MCPASRILSQVCGYSARTSAPRGWSEIVGGVKTAEWRGVPRRPHLAASSFGPRSDLDRDGGFPSAVVEDGEDLESGAEAGEVAAWGREFHVLAPFESRYGWLADAQFGGQVGLGALKRAAQLGKADLCEGDRANDRLSGLPLAPIGFRLSGSDGLEDEFGDDDLPGVVLEALPVLRV